MAERLTLYFDGSTAAWIDDSGGVSRGALIDAARYAGEHEVVVLLPGEQILLTHVALPPIRQASRRLQAARYALEDQLAGRVEQLHFALAAKTPAHEDAAVAVIDLDRMRDYCAAFDEAGLDVVQMLPDVLALPPPDAGSWQIAAMDDRVLARTGLHAGFVCDTDLWPTLAEASQPAPLHIQLHATTRPAADTLADVAWATAPEREDVIHRDRVDGTLAMLLGAPAARSSAINLRQGRFARQSQMQTWWRPLMLTAGLAATWLVIAIAARAIELYQLDHEIARLDQQSLTAFHDAFPNVKNINDMRVQAEVGIRALRGNASAGGIFPLLQATAAVTGQSDDLRLQSLQYRNGQLNLSIDGKNVQSVETLRAGFAQQTGTQLSVQSADASSAGVQIRAAVTGTSS